MNRAAGTRLAMAQTGVPLRLPLVVPGDYSHDNEDMRGLASILVVVLILGGVYYNYARKMPAPARGTSPTQAISLTGLKSDLLQIAQAERAYIAEHGSCASLADLTSQGALAMPRDSRDGYRYSVECAGTDFTVRAEHPPAAKGSTVRFPALVIDQTMEVRELN